MQRQQQNQAKRTVEGINLMAPTQVNEIGLRITEKAWRGLGDKSSDGSLVGFICQPDNRNRLFPDVSNAQLSEEQAHNLAINLLNRFWSPERNCTAIVCNISMDDKRRIYLVRTVLEGAATAGYCTDEGIPAFRCILKGGYFRAIDLETGLYSEELDSEELILTGPVYIQTPPVPGQALVKTRRPKPFPDEVLTKISSLVSKRLIVARKLADWNAFLDWELNLVRQRQIGLLYTDVEVDESDRYLRFAISAAEEQWRKFKSMRPFGLSVMPLYASKNQAKWEPVENPRGVSLGEFSPPRKQITQLLSNNRNTSDMLTDIIEIHPDPDIWEKCHRAIPEQGFLTSEIYQMEIPIKRLREAVQKLIRAEVANPRLADFLFDANKARVPDVPVIELAAQDWAYLQEVTDNARTQ